MVIKKSDKERFKVNPLVVLEDLINQEHSASVDRLKKAVDLPTLRYTQGQIHVLESIQQLMNG